MSAVILPYRNPFAVVDTEEWASLPTVAQIVEHGEKIFIIEEDLGRALGYAEPLKAMELLYGRYCPALRMHSQLMDLHEPEAYGRPTVRAFDLTGALLVCTLARTPKAALLFVRLNAWTVNEIFIPSTTVPSDRVVALPKPRKARKPGKGRRHG